MHLRYNGDVGIGTNAPRYSNSLDIFGKHLTLSETFPLSWMVGNSSTFRGRYLCDSGGNFVWQFGSTITERVRFKSDGKVGIGTDNPHELLHVKGNIKATNAGLQTSFLVTGTQFDVRQTNLSGWSNTTYATTPIIKYGWISGAGDHLYFSSGGNTATTSQMSMLLYDVH